MLREGRTVKAKIRLVLVVAIALVSLLPGELAAQRSSDFRDLQDLSESFRALSQTVGPAVVQILATGYTPLQQGDAPGTGLLTRRQGIGSGVILDPNGYIITNLHVIEGAGRIRVRLPIPVDEAQPGESILKPEGKVVGAQIVGVDRETDLAVLKVQESNLPALDLSDSDDVRTGQLVFAFGSPMGLDNSVTMGIVSAVARQLRPEDPMIYIQTDATINPGNSGGPLVNAEGKIVGINTLILSLSGGSEGIGFAAPSNIVRNVFQQIKLSGYVRRGEVGVNAQTITPTLAAGIGLDRDWGVVLGDVYPSSPAEQAGLQVGDIVLSVEGKLMENGRQFNVHLYGRPVGERVTMEILRDGERMSVPVPVYERSDDTNRFTFMVTPEDNLISRLGILALDLSPQAKALLPGLRSQSGVLVAARSPDAIYGRVALMPGDVIVSLNESPVTSLVQLQRSIEAVRIGQAVVLHVERRGKMEFVAFEME
jgi:serine protease Do